LRIRQHGAGNDEAHMGAIGVFLAAGEKDRLKLAIAILGCAVRQKRLVAYRPKRRVERPHPLLAIGFHHRPPATIEAELEQARQYLLQRLAFDLVEQDLGHFS
jgi:hypothetical protein